ncbi:hypothetical protein [Lentisalinibacter salinarum]|uniref:hypothetical protein n=1 Tax=Lentisalinibacter salinarum TaxID=2992239 RepID=UPI003863A3E3
MLLLCALSLGRVPFASAVELLTLDIDEVTGAGWSADGIELRILPGDGSGDIGASLRVQRLVLPEPIGELRDVTLRCDTVAINGTDYRCERGRALARRSPLDPHAFSLSGSYRPADGRLVLESPDLPWQGLTLRVSGQLADGGWTAAVEGADLDAATLYRALATTTSLVSPSSAASAMPELEIAAGTAGFRLRARGENGDASRIDGTITLRDLSLANDSGSLAAEGLAVTLEAQVRMPESGGQLDYTVKLGADAGEAYVEPAYFNLSASPLTLGSTGGLDPAGGPVRIDSFTLDHRDVLAASGAAVLRRGEEPALAQADVEITGATFPGVYTTYLQGFLTGTPLAKLETRGRVSGRVRLDDGRISALDLALDDLHADDAGRRLAIYGARGNVAWDGGPDAGPRPSRLAWDGGFVYEAGFGAGTAAFSSMPDRITLQETLRVPVLDGALVVETFAAHGLTADEPAVEFDARLEPVSLAGITTALGWPALPGKLSGELPLLSVSEGAVTLGGSLVARVFDGTARISELRIEQPFGANRRTSGEVTLDNLDLALVTDVFTFGRITGRLDGAIRSLEMLQGRPIAFDARFYTPADDESPHRISRRALSNISEIAGSGTAALSAGFLGLFDEFRYDSLGIRCVLEGDVCNMSGVQAAQQGYYLVKGSGLPRIDVIGHSREVNWPRLVAQITEALKSREVSTSPQSEERR